jgi:ABC-type sugar transport system permease subunit
MENTSAQVSQSPLIRLLLGLVVGLVLLTPLVVVLVQVQLNPATETYAMSLTDNNLLGRAEGVEQENYERLAEDPRLAGTLAFSARMMQERVLAVAIIPVVIGLLVGIQGLAGRVLNRVVMGILTIVTAPVVYLLLWRMYWSPFWGREPSPVYPPPDEMFLTNPEGAQNALLQIDSALTIAIALVALVAVYAAVVRGWRRGRLWSAVQAGAGAWLISLALAGFSGFFQVFTLPFYLTRGGPLNSTMTYPLYMYHYGFTQFRFGYSTALASYLIGAALSLAFFVWLVTVVFRLRLSFTPPARTFRLNNVLAVITIPALLVLALPLLNMVIWGSGQAATNGTNLDELSPSLSWATVQGNTLVSLGAIWLIMLPTTYLAGLALGFVRPLGRIVSNILFLPLLLLAFIPAEGLMFAWFVDGRDQSIMNTAGFMNVPWLVSGLALLVFKLFFDGAHERYRRARQQSSTSQSVALLYQVFLPSLLIALLVGIVASFASTQDLLWPLAAANDPDLYTIPVTLAQLMGMFSADTGIMITAIMSFFNFLLWFVVPFVLLQVFVVDRLALLGGKADYRVYDAPAPDSPDNAPVIDLEG